MTLWFQSSELFYNLGRWTGLAGFVCLSLLIFSGDTARFFDRSIFLKFDGYDTKITGPEDYDLPLRMKKSGIKIGRIGSFILHNEKNFSPLASMKKKFYYAAHAKEYLRKHPQMLFAQGNLIFRPVFVKKWRKLIAHPFLSLGMIFIKLLETFSGFAGLIYSAIIQQVYGRNNQR